MARLFITPKEIQLINDWTKELVKDVVGQKIYYYGVSTKKTKVHSVYDEAQVKVFENPITLPVLAGQPKWETKHNAFCMEQTTSIEVYIQGRELIDKKVMLSEGDFFTYGDAVYEVVSFLQMNNIYGQEEYGVSYKLMGRLARPGQFDPKVFFRPQKDGVDYTTSQGQHFFTQQRGLQENEEGSTGDFRQVRDRLGDDMAPIALGDGPRTVDMTDPENKEKTSSFNNDPLPPKKGFYDE